MDTSDRDIEFDADGRCNHCSEYFDRTLRRTHYGADAKQQLPQLVERVKRAGVGGAYDCVIGVSGGADSSYVAHVAVSLGLRVLAVHMDNGWDTAIAVQNVKNLVERLNLDYMSCVLDWDEFRDLQLAFLKASVPEIETPTDIAIPAALHQVAAEHGIKHIVTGGNVWTEGILPRSWHYDAKDVKYLRSIHRQFGTRRLRTFPTFGYQQETYYKVVKGIRFVYLLEHLDYTTRDAVAILKDKYDWRPPGGKHHESTITRFVQSYILPTKFDIDYRRATLSTQICAGEVTRERALEELKKPPFDPRQVAADKHYVAKKFGLDEAALDAILALPPKSHRDYPNNEAFLTRVYDVYWRFFSPRRRRDDALPLPITARPGAASRDVRSAETSGDRP